MVGLSGLNEIRPYPVLGRAPGTWKELDRIPRWRVVAAAGWRQWRWGPASKPTSFYQNTTCFPCPTSQEGNPSQHPPPCARSYAYLYHFLQAGPPPACHESKATTSAFILHQTARGAQCQVRSRLPSGTCEWTAVWEQNANTKWPLWQHSGALYRVRWFSHNNSVRWALPWSPFLSLGKKVSNRPCLYVNSTNGIRTPAAPLNHPFWYLL